MSQLEDRLLASLGTQYRLERELGGGGMSRVFLAEEIALERKVVLKVLPPELAGVLSPERFQREVRLAASLQHPHIVPLLAAGSADGILYYTMPFVAGESLRAKIDREGALPVAEAVRYFRDATDALVAAHARGIVHRDIKPDNILLTHQHAVVTDFGIAKAVSEAGGGSTLTGTGLAIGTPAYMAPEQAAGESNVDHRADLYALGVVAYEMFAGEPPFRGPTQAMIAAHLSRAPAPLTDLRPNLPPALARLVARCLEKLPADRHGNAAELLAELDAVAATLSGATVASQAAASAASSATREWPLPSLLGYFALAAVAVLGLAWALRTLLGLPDWFFPAVVVLLVLGLPIVVLAGSTHNRRLSGGTAVNLPVPGNLHHRLSLKRAVTGGIAAFSGLGLITGAYMAMRLLGIGPVGSLVASGKLAERERLIIADFANQTRDSLLGPAVTQAFRVDFSQSKLVSPVEADYVRRVLRRMQRPDSMPVDLAVAREIAQREGFKAVVAGELQQVGPSLLVSAQLVNAQSGEVLAVARETAKDSTGILDAVDRVSKQLREKIGESLRSIRSDAALADVTTGSLEALRKYSQSLRLQSAGDAPGAVALLEDAVALDSTFAMAWRKLGTMLINAGIRPTRAKESLTRAYGLRDRLTFRERKLTETSYYSDVRGETDSAIATLQSIIAEYPNDSWAHNNLGVMYETTGHEEDAERSYFRAATLEPENILAWGNILTLRIGAGRFDSAAATLALMKERFAAGPAMDFRVTVLLLGRRDFAAAEDSLRVMTSRYQSNTAWHDRFLNNLAGVLAIRGKVEEANRALATLAEQRASRGETGNALETEVTRVMPVALFREDKRAAKAMLDGLLKSRAPERMAEPERPLVSLINTAVAVGDRETATRFLEEFSRHPGNIPGRAWNFLKAATRGSVLAMSKESIPEALAEFRKSAATCMYCVDPPMALAFERAGMTDSALAHFQRWADRGENVWEAGVYFHWAPIAYIRLGEMYEAKGEKAKAMDYYGRFTELWREADPEFQPKVKEVKRRLAELGGEPRQ